MARHRHIYVALWSVDSLAAQLLRPAASWERPPPAFDDVGELVDVDDANLPAELVEALCTVLRLAEEGPVRLSTLLSTAAAVDGPSRLSETVWAASLWVWVADNTADDEAQPAHAGLARLLAGLAAADDGTALISDSFIGPDLLVGPVAEVRAGMRVLVGQEEGR